eukprot:jgi/Botrbrau1/20874/Bobra.0135s0009.1
MPSYIGARSLFSRFLLPPTIFIPGGLLGSCRGLGAATGGYPARAQFGSLPNCSPGTVELSQFPAGDFTLVTLASKAHNIPFCRGIKHTTLKAPVDIAMTVSKVDLKRLSAQRNGARHPIHIPGVGVYTGEWVNDRRHGNGTMVFDNGDKYEGNFVSNKFDGRGDFWKYTCGRYTLVYRGEWKKGLRHGVGEQYCEMGDIYQGAFINGVCHGMGRCVYASGEVYQGQWQADTRLELTRANGTMTRNTEMGGGKREAMHMREYGWMARLDAECMSVNKPSKREMRQILPANCLFWHFRNPPRSFKTLLPVFLSLLHLRLKCCDEPLQDVLGLRHYEIRPYDVQELLLGLLQTGLGPGHSGLYAADSLCELSQHIRNKCLQGLGDYLTL